MVSSFVFDAKISSGRAVRLVFTRYLDGGQEAKQCGRGIPATYYMPNIESTPPTPLASSTPPSASRGIEGIGYRSKRTACPSTKPQARTADKHIVNQGDRYVRRDYSRNLPAQTLSRYRCTHGRRLVVISYKAYTPAR